MSASISPKLQRPGNTSSNNFELKSKILKSPDVQRKKFLQMITFLDQQNQNLEKQLAKEKRRRTEELSRIIKSLLYFEAKLKSEKQAINQKLYEKDDEISRLVRLNRALKKKFIQIDDDSIESNDVEQKSILKNQNDSNDGNENDNNTEDDVNECKYPEAMFCNNCRKEFYGLDGKENWTQTGKDSRILKGDHYMHGNIEHGSSSDETLSSSFCGARRSIRYTSKRTFGTFRDYMRSRFMSIDDPNLDNSEENASTVSRDESQTSYEKLNYSQTIERMHNVRRILSFQFDSENENNSNSSLRQINNNNNFSSSGPETDHDHSPNENEIEEDEVFYPAQSISTTSNSSSTCNQNKQIKFTTDENDESGIVRQEFETSTNDWYASGSDPDDDNESTNHNVRTKSYGYNAVNPVLECVNQILLQQSMEDCLHSSNSNSTTNITMNNTNSNSSIVNNTSNGPTSLDSNDNNNSGSSTNGSNLSSGSTTSKDGIIVNRKRVHFSTKNSMVHVPRNEDHTDILMKVVNIGQNTTNTDQKLDNSFNYESIYSNNEYEPIGSEHNSSNLYIDMDGSKLDNNDHQLRSNTIPTTKNNKLTKIPPALPPKPANLIKFKRSIKSNPDNNNQLNKNNINLINDCDQKSNSSCTNEPDYCSISEVNEAITSVQIIADVHKVPPGVVLTSSSSATSSSSSSATSMTSDNILFKKNDDADAEIFADIPKLPNVAAIIAPKQSNKIMNNDSYVTKSLSLIKEDLQITKLSNINGILSSGQQQQQLQQQQSQHYRPKSPGQVKRQHVPNILAEINKKIQNSTNNNNVVISNQTSPGKINLNNISVNLKKHHNSSNHYQQQQKQQQQQYHNTILKQPILKQSNSYSLLQTASNNDKLPMQDEFDWYNLDVEYGKSNQPDVVVIKSSSSTSAAATSSIPTTVDSNDSDNNNDLLNDSIEYNLDEEFSLMNQPDIIKEQIEENLMKTSVVEIEDENVDNHIKNIEQENIDKRIMKTTNLQHGFATISDCTPTDSRSKMLKTKTNFVKFINTAGLSTKPLPRQRKIYFSGPFV